MEDDEPQQMSREEQISWHWLSGYRLAVTVIVMLLLMGTLARVYLRQREAALETAMATQAGQFAERAQRLHGLWLEQRHPPQVFAEGQLWLLSQEGWPQAVAERRNPSEDCLRLWQALIGSELAGEPVTGLALTDGSGCEWSLAAAHWRYDWQDGRVTERVRY